MDEGGSNAVANNTPECWFFIDIVTRALYKRSGA
jgi:hypothetical protein